MAQGKEGRRAHRVGKADTDSQHDAADDEHAEAGLPGDSAGGEASSDEVADTRDDHADLAALELGDVAGHKGGKESCTLTIHVSFGSVFYWQSILAFHQIQIWQGSTAR